MHLHIRITVINAKLCMHSHMVAPLNRYNNNDVDDGDDATC